jgi:hypothetical protein
VPFTIDPGSAAFLATLEPGAFLGWTKDAAVCFPNLDEAAVLSGLAGAVADVTTEVAVPATAAPATTAAGACTAATDIAAAAAMPTRCGWRRFSPAITTPAWSSSARTGR